jgi:acyl-CoA synthetase (AMP-forming)/AMP-acid ligase II
VQLQREFPDVFDVPLRSVWSSTEATVGFVYGLQPGPVSRIAPGAQVRLTSGGGALVRRGKVGELLVRAPHVTVGYWAGPGRVVAATCDGWFHTGDLMRRARMTISGSSPAKRIWSSGAARTSRRSRSSVS